MTTNKSGKEKACAILAYISWILFAVAFFVSQDCRSEYVKLHLNQGLMLQLLATAEMLIAGLGLKALASVLSIAVLVFLIWGVVNAARGSEQPIPGLSIIRLFE